MRKASSGTLVYSTESGRICSACSRPVDSCACKSLAQSAVIGNGAVRVALQTKGRGGKSVTVVKGVALDAMALAVLGKQLRAACGAGGTVKDGVIEVQGDHVELILAALLKQGYAAKKGS